MVRPPGGEEGFRLALWAAEALLGSGAFAAVALDVPAGRAFRGAETALRRLVTAAEQGGSVGLWLSAPNAALRPPALVRLELRSEQGRILARRADGQARAARAGSINVA
jgi:protein ImuA